MTTDPDRAEALTDLRKAYRLVWAYQRQVLDMVQIIADAFGDLSFYHWVSHGHDVPGPKQAPLDRWAWNFLPLYDMSVLFAGEGANRRGARVAKGDLLLEVWIRTDKGFAERDDGEEPDARDFVDAATAVSTLSIVLWQAREDIDGNWRHNAWGLAISAPDNEQLGQLVLHEEPPLSALRMEWDLADIATHEDLDDAIDKFKAALRDSMGLTIA